MHGLAERLLIALGHEPTEGQHRAADALERLLATDREHATLVLKGYAGTGKTSLVGALVKTLSAGKRPVVLMAPTGRAAKVLGAYARHFASTIHRRIYKISGEDDGFGTTVSAHKDVGALFIVDEASMIGRSGSESSFGGGDLLSDLFEHVFSVAGCKLLLIGDPAQLPPVGSDHSPALEIKDLKELGLTAGVIQLTEVVRQAEASGILVNATALRGILNEEKPTPKFISGYADVERIDGHDLQDALETAYSREGADEVCLICRSNKRAYEFNQQVRMRIYGHEEELSGGDRLMVVKNNYFWASTNGRPDLIANGETIQVQRVGKVEERFGLRFCDISVTWWNGFEERGLDVKVMLDVLASTTPALPGERQREFTNNLIQSFTARNRTQLYRMLKEDPYANALQVKFAYAVTAHKAQGGQWNTVFVDQGYVTEEMLDKEYVRWLYTAITRASEKLYLVNFHRRFWGEEDE